MRLSPFGFYSLKATAPIRTRFGATEPTGDDYLDAVIVDAEKVNPKLAEAIKEKVIPLPTMEAYNNSGGYTEKAIEEAVRTFKQDNPEVDLSRVPSDSELAPYLPTPPLL